MKIAVRYYTKTGNTKKLADSIASELNVKAHSITKNVDSDTDVLFLGSSVYAAGVAEEVKEFISSLDENIGVIVNFSTAAVIKSTYKQVKKLVEEQNINMSTQEFHCRGKFAMLHRNKPDLNDLKEVSEFAKNFIEKYN